MKVQLTARFSNRVIFECEVPEDIAILNLRSQRGYAVREAIKAGSNLRGSNLRDSDLRDSDLRGSNLSDSNLSDSNLSGSDLRGSDLSDSDLRGSNLRDSDLRGSDLRDSDLRDSDLRDSDLRDSDLRGSDLSDSNLRGSNLSGSNLRGSDLRGSDLSGARNVPADLPTPAPLSPEERAQLAGERAARYRLRHPEVPVVEALDAKILGAIESGSGRLDMTAWHRCETTHCRAGWAVTVAGEAGKALEDKFGPEWAGRMIYTASTGKVPDFFASDDVAMADIRACAGEQIAQSAG